jgi:serine/threonine protein phosphatase PrpC
MDWIESGSSHGSTVALRERHVSATACIACYGMDVPDVVDCEHGLVIALADGAGGTSGGDRAATAVVNSVARVASHAYDWSMLLAQLDHDHIGIGQTTAVVLWVTRDRVVGASAGDSIAWVIRGNEVVELTEAQQRKPLIGDGAIVTPIDHGPLGGDTLLVASDGLWRYAKPIDIARIATGPDLATAAKQLVALVRLPSGQVPDDVSIVLCRATR